MTTTKMIQTLTFAILAVVLMGATSATAQDWRCFPSCDATDGRMFGTTSNGFANTDGFGEERFIAQFAVPAGTSELTLGIFDPDDRGPVAGGLWDADFDTEPMVLRYRVCSDPDADSICNEVHFEALSSDAALSASDNAWFDMTIPTDSGAQGETGNYFYLLEIEVATVEPGDARFNMLRLRVAAPGTIFLPAQPFGFGVPMLSMAEANVIYPNGFGDLSASSYDGSWNFTTVLGAPAEREIADALTIWDGDFDYGTAQLPAGTQLTEDTQVCFALGTSNPASFDDNDLDTLATDLPPFMAGAAAATQISVASESGGAVQAFQDGQPVECYTLGAPADNWVYDDPDADYGVFKRETTSFGMNVAYQVTDPVGRTFTNANPSGNREYERFTVSEADDCTAATADHCVTGERLASGPYAVRVEGMDVMNISHIFASVCVGDDNGNCVPTACSECDGKLTELSMRYNGEVPAQVRITQKKGAQVLDRLVMPGEIVTVLGRAKFDTLSTEIKIYVDGDFHAQIHTSCSVPVGAGYVAGDFEVVRGYSRNGGLLCELPAGTTKTPSRSR